MNELIAYAYRFIAYLMEQPFLQKSKLKKIILYGSTVRGDYTKSSDIDLFFDVSKASSILTEKILKAERAFRKKDKKSNEFSIIIDDLDKRKWDDLRRAMSFHAIELWNRYSTTPTKGLKQYALISWSVSAKDASTRVKLARALHGYVRDKKHYPGLLEQINAKKISQGVALIEGKHVNKIRAILDEIGVRHTIRDIYRY